MADEAVTHLRVPRGYREQFLPIQFSFEDLVAKQGRLLRRLGEKPQGAYGRQTPADVFRDYLHELSHHVALSGLVFDKKRDSMIINAIGGMGYGAQDGNELDALAIELETSWWLRRPLRAQDTVAGVFLVISRSAARQAVATLRTRVWDREAFHLAVAIYNEPLPQVRRRKT